MRYRGTFRRWLFTGYVPVDGRNFPLLQTIADFRAAIAWELRGERQVSLQGRTVEYIPGSAQIGLLVDADVQACWTGDANTTLVAEEGGGSRVSTSCELRVRNHFKGKLYTTFPAYRARGNPKDTGEAVGRVIGLRSILVRKDAHRHIRCWAGQLAQEFGVPLRQVVNGW